MKALDVKLVIDENATFQDDKGNTKIYTKYEIHYAGAVIQVGIKPGSRDLAKFLFDKKN